MSTTTLLASLEKDKCVETSFFLKTFNEKVGSKVIEVGSNDESSDACIELAERGYQVTAIDLRESNQKNRKYHYIQGDFCQLSAEFLCRNMGQVDSIFSISTIEHFGLNAYQEGGRINPNYDSIAMHQIWQLLKEEGTAYISVPFGRQFFAIPKAWRVYDETAMWWRIIQDFTVESIVWFFSGSIGGASGGGELNGKWRTRGTHVKFEEAKEYSGNPPHLTVFLKLRKITKKRISPDGLFSKSQQ